LLRANHLLLARPAACKAALHIASHSSLSSPPPPQQLRVPPRPPRPPRLRGSLHSLLPFAPRVFTNAPTGTFIPHPPTQHSASLRDLRASAVLSSPSSHSLPAFSQTRLRGTADRTSNIEHRTSNIEHRISNIQYRPSPIPLINRPRSPRGGMPRSHCPPGR
jgi:hypothetical protein